MMERITVATILERMQENWSEAACPETRVMLGLIRLNDLVFDSTNKVIAGFGLTPTAFEVLVTLRSLPEPREITPTELYRSILVTSGGMTKVLKQLEAKGLITRLENDADLRSKLVKLTRAGEKHAEELMRAVSENDRKMLSAALTSAQVTELGDTILNAVDKLESQNVGS